MHVLLVEDDPSVRGAVERALRGAGHNVELVTAGDKALAAATANPYDAIVLDRGLPGLDGIEVCRRLRGAGNAVPILMLTARAAVSERVEGLDAGADDYVVKPFALDELLARLRAFERRTPPTGQTRGTLQFEDLELDRDAMTARRGGREIALSRTEYQLLELLLSNPKRVLSRDVIFEKVWGYDFGPDSNSLDVYIGYLRRKLEQDGEPRLIHTVRGVGYVLRDRA
jgi:two-component system response regulator MprA